MRRLFDKKKGIAWFVCIIMFMTTFCMGSECAVYGLSEKSSNGSDLNGLQPAAQLGLLITGSKVNGNKGFLKDIIYLTKQQMAELQTDKNPEKYGLGDSWQENKRYSSYDNHGTGTYHYSIAAGIDTDTILKTVVDGGIDAVDTYWIRSADSFSGGMSPKSEGNLKYFAPGNREGVAASEPMIALYKTTNETSDPRNGIEPEGSPTALAAGESVFIFGQNSPTDDNNCHFVKHVTAMYVEDPKVVLRTANDRFTMKRLEELMELGIYRTSYSFQKGNSSLTCNLEGVPLSRVLTELKLDSYLSPYADNRLQLVSQSGQTRQVMAADLSKCFLAWGFSDDAAAPDGQTGQLAVFLPGTTEADTAFYNVSELNVVDAKGTVVTTVPQKPSPAAPAAFKAAKKSYNSINLSWAKNSAATGYELYRYSAKSANYEKIKTFSAGTTAYTDTGLATNTNYRYRIRSYTAVNGVNYEGAMSAEVSAKPVLNRGAITKLTKSKKKAVRIKWKKVPGASGYQIYRAVKKSGKYKKTATVRKGAKTFCTNKNLKRKKTYYYKIRPYRIVSGKYQYGSFSKIKKIRR